MNPRSVLSLDAIRPWLEKEGFVSRDWGLLGSALERPWMTFDGDELYPTIWLKTAALIDSIESSHPLIDGNKRLGALLSMLMLDVHGIDRRTGSDDFWFDLICTVAESHPSVEIIAAKLEKMHS